jgi:hypothetical protein
MARPATYNELRRLQRHGELLEQLPKVVVACALPRVDEDEEPYLKVEVREKDLESCPRETTLRYPARRAPKHLLEEVTVRLEVLEHDGSVDRDYEGSPFS